MLSIFLFYIFILRTIVSYINSSLFGIYLRRKSTTWFVTENVYLRKPYMNSKSFVFPGTCSELKVRYPAGIISMPFCYLFFLIN